MKKLISLLLVLMLAFAVAVSIPAQAEVIEAGPDEKPANLMLMSLMPTAAPAPSPYPTPMPTAKLPPQPAPAAEPEAEDDTGEQAAVTEKRRFYISVNYTCNTVNVYEKDADGYYSVPYKAMVCSTGDATPGSGVYRLGARYRWQALFGDVYGQYCTQITGNILFHSVPYLTNYDPGSLEYWEFDRLGTACSAGCIRLQVKDAKWIYDNAYQIEAVEFYSSSDPGPLGKPSAPLISDNIAYRGWDPSDPDANNPWITGVVPAAAEDEGGTQSTGEQTDDAQAEAGQENSAPGEPVYADDSSSSVLIGGDLPTQDREEPEEPAQPEIEDTGE